eukprot:3726396-Amphidinium_carterae.1
MQSLKLKWMSWTYNPSMTLKVHAYLKLSTWQLPGCPATHLDVIRVNSFATSDCLLYTSPSPRDRG